MRVAARLCLTAFACSIIASGQELSCVFISDMTVLSNKVTVRAVNQCLAPIVAIAVELKSDNLVRPAGAVADYSPSQNNPLVPKDDPLMGFWQPSTERQFTIGYVSQGPLNDPVVLATAAVFQGGRIEGSADLFREVFRDWQVRLDESHAALDRLAAFSVGSGETSELSNLKWKEFRSQRVERRPSSDQGAKASVRQVYSALDSLTGQLDRLVDERRMTKADAHEILEQTLRSRITTLRDLISQFGGAQ